MQYCARLTLVYTIYEGIVTGFVRVSSSRNLHNKKTFWDSNENHVRIYNRERQECKPVMDLRAQYCLLLVGCIRTGMGGR